ncbi:GATA transcription factor 8-like [Magnolia sinica]|uniref:GATA transcription factor 8-like n=1 Tax=Magnolia sinica TaxID=86752 RepID=UPI0026589090|nr:GATA transcription factor 8-like [Magnolia sinica]XP_058094487.1 GATA transcription factor 8-like [Magnolia sinica]
MMGPGSVDGADTDICGDFFDHIEDLLDFPNEEEIVGIGGGVGDVGNGGFLEGSWPSVPEELLPFSNSAFSGISSSTTTTSTSQNTEEDLAAELSVSCEDIAQLEWLSTFVEDSFSAGSIDLDNDHNNKEPQFRTSSPVSVLETSSCSGKPMLLGPDTIVPGRARSKRPRPASFSPRQGPIVSSASSENHNTTPLLLASSFPSELKHFAESVPQPKKVPKKKKLILPLPPAGDQEASKPVRKCMHCEIQKTPQWRMGPMGPKTLCNACGVRYKSGRLYPEYRPAASPTYVAAVHSNSHKKVLEMRVKTGQKAPAPVPEFVRKTSHLLDCN